MKHETNTLKILYVLLNDYADHEVPFLSQTVNVDEQGYRKKPKYVNKIVASSMEPVKSIGGFRTLPDYTFDTFPEDYAALVLIGGYGWLTPESENVLPLVQDAMKKGIVIGAICNAASWMAKQGFLNNIKHTGNGIDQLKNWAGENYTNEGKYVNEQAVSDGNIVTANGSGQLEFACELLNLLKVDTPEAIERYQMFYKLGFVELVRSMTSENGQ